MPQRTISATGGNWNSTSTWVEGAIPTSSDFVVGNASSGQLTINVTTASVQYVDFTTYTNTLTINSSFNFNLGSLASSTSIFNAGSYNFLGTGASQGIITLGVASRNIQQIGGSPSIPRIRFGGTNTLLSNINIINFVNSGRNLGNNIFVSGDFLTTETNTDTTTTINLIGSGTIQSILTNNPATCGHKIIFNTTGTYNILSPGLVLTLSQSLATTAGQFIYSAGTITNASLSTVDNSLLTSGRVIIDLNGYNFTNITLGARRSNATHLNVIELLSPLTTTNLYISFTDVITSSNQGSEGDYFRILGNKLNVNNLIFETSVNLNQNQTGGISSYDRSWLLELDTNYTHEIDNLYMGGNPSIISAYRPRLKSNINGTPANILLDSNVNSYAAYSNITDITITGSTPLYSYFSTLTNTTQITNLTTFVPSGVGGGETSSVFIS